MLLRWPFVLVISVLSLVACARPELTPASTPAVPSTPAVAPSPTRTPTTAPTDSPTAAFVPGEILVMFKPGTEQSQIDSLNKQHGATVLSSIPDFNLYHLKVAESQVEAVLEGYRSSPLVQAAQRNFILRPILAPGDSR